MSLFLILALILIVLWAGGFAFAVGGSLIHFLLVVVLVLVILHFVMGRSGTGTSV